MAPPPCWSSLPSELVNHIASSFLDTADLDYYMDFRAVCHNWRSATDDPKNSRFRPTHWILLYEPPPVRDADAEDHLLVSTATGRSLRKELPLLRDGYHVAGGTSDGLLVLADRSPPHAARVLDPFTGQLIRFRAPVPPERLHVAAVSGPSPTLLLRCGSGKLYRADPDSECFVVHEEIYTCPFVRLAVSGLVRACDNPGALPQLPTAAACKILGVMLPLAPELVEGSFLVESDGEKLVIFILQQRLQLEAFKIDTEGNELEPVKSIGNRAIFIGTSLCLSVNADKFPSIEANCIYFTGSPNSSDQVDLSRLQEEDSTGGAANSVPPFVRLSRPFSIVELLLLCAANFPGHHLLEELSRERTISSNAA